MDIVNELEIRKLIESKAPPTELGERLKKLLSQTTRSWEEQRPLWHFLFNTLKDHTLAEGLLLNFKNKERVPFDLFMALTVRNHLSPKSSVVESLLKGLKKQKALDELINNSAWDSLDERFLKIRHELIEKKVKEQAAFKDGLKEKFEFLRNQRMTEQAGKVLKRMIQLYPDDAELAILKREFDELWAREVLATHIATLQSERLDRTTTEHSSGDLIMLERFLFEGEKISLEHRQFALDLAIAFWFLEDYNRALEILAWAPTSEATDWMKAELLYAARRFVEALEQLNQLEVKYIAAPETTFSVSYLRAQCLHSLGQETSALEIMQSIVRVRTNYRSAHALILEWTAGASWE